MIIRRLVTGDRDLARATFTMMAAVFDEPRRPLGDDYVDALLARDDFWAVAALEDDEPVGGITAHVLPMTRSPSRELFVYDVAVREDRQRRGIGRAMLVDLCTQAATAGIASVFVAVADEDVHAMDFYRAVGGAESPVTMFSFDLG
ncbi:MAG TPA: GNAT family N-acetyltransferase [Gemmatimonadaceae bacterium]|nr:GNAT family N-acetyltransferase [Gemmatimonadaceae bacterium]